MYAHHLFQCLTVSFHPLHVEELAEVLAVDFDSGAIPQFVIEWRPTDIQEAVLSICSTLVVLDAETQVVQFAHFSVQEYLVSQHLEHSNAARFLVRDDPAHTIMAQTCLSILLQFDHHSTQNNLKDFPLACYAARYWAGHAQSMRTSSCIKNAMECLFHPNLSHFAA